jgi:hypothetical protein
MRKHVGWILGSALLTLAITAPGLPQGVSTPAKPRALPVKIQVVLTRGEADKKISSPYTLIASSSGETASLRLGAEVPVGATGPDGQTRVTLQQIGMQIDYSVTAAGDDRFTVKLTLNVRFLSPDGQLRSLTSTTTATLRDEESTKFTGSDDSGGPFAVDVALTVMK